MGENNDILPENPPFFDLVGQMRPMGKFGAVTRRPAETMTYFNRWDNRAPGESAL
jgi:hypothetical protein